MKKPQPGIPKLPQIKTENPPQVEDVYFSLTDEQKKWPLVPMSRMWSLVPKEKKRSEPEKIQSDPS